MANIVRLTGSVTLIVVGFLFLLYNFGIIREDLFKFWPLILIILGGVLFAEHWSDKRSTQGNWGF